MENWIVPIVSDLSFLRNKNVNYRIILGIYLFSSYDEMTKERYIKKEDLIKASKKIEKILKVKNAIKNKTILKKILDLNKIEAKEFKFKEKPYGIILDVSTKLYVPIESNKVIKLMQNCSSNSIKIYIALLFLNQYNINIYYKSLMQHTDIRSEKTISRCLKELETSNFIIIEKSKKQLYDFETGTIKNFIYNKYKIL